jgi:outer membrane lipoprotein-sorting protein
MINYKRGLLLITVLFSNILYAQTAEALLEKVKSKLDRVNDYQASGKMKTNVTFIKAPIATVKIYYKKPNKLRITNESGISFIPKGSFNINAANLFLNTAGYDIIDAGKEKETNLHIIKLLPRDENSDIVLSTVYVDEFISVIKKAKITTKENGTYELEMTYGKYADYGLADKVIFSFNTKDYKLPKGVIFDYDGGQKKGTEKKLANKKGKVEIYYASYIINKGVPDSVFSR